MVGTAIIVGSLLALAGLKSIRMNKTITTIICTLGLTIGGLCFF